VYLPVAIAPLNNNFYGYLGAATTIKKFRGLLNTFVTNNQWPTYVPVYFPNGRAPAPYSLTPPPGNYPDGAYPGTVVVGTDVVFTETYATFADGSRFVPSPPLVTSNLPDTPSVTPGVAVSNMINCGDNVRLPTAPLVQQLPISRRLLPLPDVRTLCTALAISRPPNFTLYTDG
jgi:hypothetical protein